MLSETESASPSPPLRARTVMELLDATFRIYRENFVTFITLAAAVIIPISIINILVNLGTISGASSFSSNPFDSSGTPNIRGDVLAATCLGTLIVAVLGLAQTTIINGVVTWTTSERQFGRKLTLGEAWTEARPRLGKLASGYFFFYIVLFGFTFGITLLSALCPFLLILFAVIIYIGLTVGAFISPVIMLENGTSSGAISRAHSLAKGRFWQLLGLAGLIVLISFIISLAFSALVSAALIANPRSVSVTTQIVNLITSSVLNIFITPILPIAMTLLYYDNRVRQEGLDLALQAIGPEARPNQVAAPLPGGLINSADVVNMAVMVGLAIVLTLVFGTAVYGILNAIVPGLGGIAGQ